MNKWMIRCDIEGASGVTSFAQATPGDSEYCFGQKMLMNDLLAVVDELLRQDSEVWIYDMHYYGDNVERRRLDGRVKVISGKPNYTPENAGGLDLAFAGVILLGLHSMAGTPGGLLCHSYELDVQRIVLNGVRVGEIGMEAAIAGDFGVPVVLVTGDSAGMAEARQLLPNVSTVVVKESLSETGGHCYPPEETCKLLAEGTRQAVGSAGKLTPFHFNAPIRLEIVLRSGELSERVKGNLARCVTSSGSLLLEADSVTGAWLQYLKAKGA